MVTPFDIYPPYTAKERDEIERMTDPRMNWPSKQEAEADADVADWQVEGHCQWPYCPVGNCEDHNKEGT